MATTKTAELPAPMDVQVIDKDYVQKQLARLFNGLADATDNPATACDIIEKIADGIEQDPATARKILTPDNIAKAYSLKAKADAGTIKLDDIEKAFPEIAKKIPFWAIVKTFKF
ncbi:hypothetical protein GCM10028806_19590 [Spirosoma terrae]|uniref:Uncharacterized protein n=1 Tax=Spirosoma terrae TaxID=1968276 RepID=A0A6L9L2H4_9BACT|nr:hypothetical protein [Spirosoma terrae]NDU94724.1 hypothetical protein [Spirosoma terrae]